MIIFSLLGRIRRGWATVACALLLTTFIPSFAAALEPELRFGATQSVQTGPALYARHCANCHGRYDRHLLPDRSASRIRSAIRHFPAMYELRDLTDAEIEAIAAALVTSQEPRLSKSR